MTLLNLVKFTKARAHDWLKNHIEKYSDFRRHGLTAGVQGFEPQLKASKASVLPLDDTPICASTLTHWPRVFSHYRLLELSCLEFPIPYSQHPTGLAFFIGAGPTD